MLKGFEKEINELISKMSLKEKIGQLNQEYIYGTEEECEKLRQKVREGLVGSIIMTNTKFAGNDPHNRVDTSLYDEYQKIAVNESPLGIPLIFGRDVIHGHRTVYPIALASACSFNAELTEKCYRNIAKEAVNDYIHWTFSPMIDLGRDPRWGRIVEGPGEDPYLGAVMAESMVKGFQGDSLANDDSLVACAKHYVGYGASEGGRDYHRTEISDYSLYNYYLPAYRAAFNAGCGTAMSSFNDINGQPVTSSKKYLTDILRGKLGFNGYVVSDWGSLFQLMLQGTASNKYEAAVQSVNAGVDMDMTTRYYSDKLEEAVENGEVLVETIDEAVRRVLRVKFSCGLMSSPYCKNVPYDKAEHLKDSREYASESMLLLKNNKALPLNKNIKVALIGPFVHSKRELLGTWCLDGKDFETPSFYEAMCDKIGKDNMLVCEGEYNESNLEALINKADAIILALGESHMVTGEAHSIADISLNAECQKYVRLASKFQKAKIGVFFCGRPLALENIEDSLDGMLYAWHSGSETANAACDILFGDYNPNGKASITFPRKTGHIPLYYNVTHASRHVNCYYDPEGAVSPSYDDGQATPLYPFGYGLSYSEFKYSEPVCEQAEISLEDIKNGECFNFKVTVENAGVLDGKETVQLYVRDVIGSLMRPLRELKDFKKPLIKAGESVTLEFNVGADKLGFYNNDGEYIIEKGDFNVYIGENCLTSNMIKVKIV